MSGFGLTPRMRTFSLDELQIRQFGVGVYLFGGTTVDFGTRLSVLAAQRDAHRAEAGEGSLSFKRQF